MFRMTVLTCLWRRREVAEIMLDNLLAVREELSGRIAIEVVAVGSESDASRSLVTPRGFYYLEYQNQPLGAKWNAGLRRCLSTDPQAVMILGSDNIANARLFEAWATKIAHGYDYLGFLDGYMIDVFSKVLVHWGGYRGRRQNEPLGSGRCYSRQLLDKVGWVLWDPSLSSGLDWSVTQKLKTVRGIREGAWMMNVHGIRHLGIKTPDNICKFQDLLRNSRDRITRHDPEDLRLWFDEDIGDRIIHLNLGEPPIPAPPTRRQVAMKQTIEELRDTVICPRCMKVTKTKDVICNTDLRPGEEFLCMDCGTKVEEAKERERAARIPSPSDFLPAVSGGASRVQDNAPESAPVQRGGGSSGGMEGGSGPTEFKPGER